MSSKLYYFEPKKTNPNIPQNQASTYLNIAQDYLSQF